MQLRNSLPLTLLLWFVSQLQLYPQSPELTVRHDHTWGSCRGRLLLGDNELRYEASDGKHSQIWSYQDIQAVDVVSPTLIRLKSFKSQGWTKLAKDKRSEFSLAEGRLTAEHQAFLRSKLSRPMVGRLVEKRQGQGVELPVRHRHRFGGCEGRLYLAGNDLTYSTEHARDNRLWRISDIETIGSPDLYHFRITSYNETFTFDLKRPLPQKVYDLLWKKVYHLGSTYMATDE